jgi:GNAT superfamily N-acetyltransferase
MNIDGHVTLEIGPATIARWPDVVQAFGPRASSPDSCWCQRFRRHENLTNQDALHAEIRDSPVPIGLVAYVDGRPAGWTRVVPRDTLPGITGNTALRRLLDDDASAWWVTCVNLRREARGRGIGAVLLRAAAEHAGAHGASVLDGHPVDTGMLQGHPSPSALFTGTVSMFTAAGFHEIGRTYPSRPVMRIVPGRALRDPVR